MDMNNEKKYKKILIVRTDRLGDVVLSTPVIKAMRDAYPESYIAFMTRPYARDIVEGNPYLNEVILYDKKGKEKGFFGNLVFIKELKDKGFDVAVILHPNVRAHVITFMAGIPERVGYDKKFGFLLTKRIPHTKQFGLKHEVDYNLDVLKYIGIEPKDRTVYVPIRRHGEVKIDALFEKSGVSSADIIVALNPSASCPSKRWPVERFADIANILIEKYKVKIFVVSSSDDKGLGDRLAALIKGGCVNLSGHTVVMDLASLLKRAKLFISNDSGPVHIASALGTPTIAIFGRSDRGLSPERWGPTGKRDVALHKDIGCPECAAHECAIGFKCLEAVTVEDVLAAADKILAG